MTLSRLKTNQVKKKTTNSNNVRLTSLSHIVENKDREYPLDTKSSFYTTEEAHDDEDMKNESGIANDFQIKSEESPFLTSTAKMIKETCDDCLKERECI